MDRKNIGIRKNFIVYDNKRAIRALFVTEADFVLFETASELLEAAKELVASLEDASEDRNEEGNVFPDVLRVKKVIKRIEE